MGKCDICVMSRVVVSENGYHSLCTLSAKAARDCLLGKRDRCLPVHDSNGERRGDE